MSRANKFTQTQIRRIHEVGRLIEMERMAQRLSIREAARRTYTARGSMTEWTWRRVEKGAVGVVLNGKTEEIVYRPTAGTLMAMAEVLGLDGEDLCKRVGLEPPPKLERRKPDTEIEQIRLELVRLIERLGHIEAGMPSERAAR